MVLTDNLYVSRANLHTIRTDLAPPTQTIVRQASISQDHTVQTNFKNIDMYVATYNEAQARFTTATSSTGKVSTLTSDDLFLRFLYRVIMFFVDNGTSDKMNPGNRLIFFFTRVPTTGSSPVAGTYAGVYARDVRSAILGANTSVRRWCRLHAAFTYEMLNSQITNHDPALATKWGYRREERALAFDFADAIPVSQLNTTQTAAVSAAKAANTARDRANTGTVINASFVYSQGQLGAASSMNRLLPPPAP